LLKPENKEKLMAVLLLHVVPGEVFASDVVSLSEAKTAGGETVKFSTRSGVKVGTASGISNIVKTDIKASNGVIHVIDAVILP
ncbi:MAG: fasciclin domain-containing protein, partial [Pirellulales bacterium]